MQQFRAEICRQGPNPYVDVPARVTSALAEQATAGRVPVEGTIAGAPFRATLVPVGGGRQRLYVNGGMRAAAGVGVGDVVTVRLHAVPAGQVTVPTDLAATLDAEPGARAAFDGLTPAHRRQLLRYVDDARTPATRARRLARVADQAMGRPATGVAPRGSRPPWTCPDCGQRFVHRNAYHSCRRHELDEPFAKRPTEVRALFDRFREMVEACGPVTLVPYRDRVGFMVDVRFAQATPGRSWLDVGLWLPRRVESPRFRRIETIYPHAHLHVLRVTNGSDLDEEVAGWVLESYAVGRRQHLTPASNVTGAPTSPRARTRA